MDAGLLSALPYAAPVALAAVGETINQRAGVINIGLEGAMLTAAFVGMLACHATGCPWIGLGAGVLAGLVVTLLFAVFTVILAEDQVVVGTAVNLLAMGVTSTVYRAQFGQTGTSLAVATLPKWHGIDPVFAFLVPAVPIVAYVLFRTGWGLALRGAGEYPPAIEAAGLSVVKLRLQALAVGGVFAGLAGVYLSLVITGSFAENMTAGRGFVAIAMVTFGRWRPQLAAAAAVFVGLLDALQYRFQALGWKAPYQLFIALPYVVALLVLVVVGKGGLAPEALGRAYRRER